MKPQSELIRHYLAEQGKEVEEETELKKVRNQKVTHIRTKDGSEYEFVGYNKVYTIELNDWDEPVFSLYLQENIAWRTFVLQNCITRGERVAWLKKFTQEAYDDVLKQLACLEKMVSTGGADVDNVIAHLDKLTEMMFGVTLSRCKTKEVCSVERAKVAKRRAMIGEDLDKLIAEFMSRHASAVIAPDGHARIFVDPDMRDVYEVFQNAKERLDFISRRQMYRLDQLENGLENEEQRG